jgi:hypothetical protein
MRITMALGPFLTSSAKKPFILFTAGSNTLVAMAVERVDL